MTESKPKHVAAPPIVFFAIGAFILYMCVPKIINGLESSTWPKVEGKVLAAKIIKTDDEGKIYFQPEIKYEFHVNNVKFVSDHLTYNILNYRFKSKRDALNFIAEYTVNEPVQVYYKKENPKLSVLIQGQNKNQFIVLTIGIGMIFGGVVVLVKSKSIIKGIKSEISSESPVPE